LRGPTTDPVNRSSTSSMGALDSVFLFLFIRMVNGLRSEEKGGGEKKEGKRKKGAITWNSRLEMGSIPKMLGLRVFTPSTGIEIKKGEEERGEKEKKKEKKGNERETRRIFARKT